MAIELRKRPCRSAGPGTPVRQVLSQEKRALDKPCGKKGRESRAMNDRFLCRQQYPKPEVKMSTAMTPKVTPYDTVMELDYAESEIGLRLADGRAERILLKTACPTEFIVHEPV